MRSDQGEHHFTYAFTAWTGDFTASPVVTEGYELNQPILLSEGSAPAYSAFVIDRPNIILETVKEAEDESEDLILRLYESKGATTRCRLGLGFSTERVQRCDMLENPQGDLALEENVIVLSFRPFEIVTLRVSGN